MATPDNDLTSTKCWLKLHSNLKEGDEIEDKAKCQCLRWLPLTLCPQAPGAGASRGSPKVVHSMLPGCNHLARWCLARA